MQIAVDMDDFDRTDLGQILSLNVNFWNEEGFDWLTLNLRINTLNISTTIFYKGNDFRNLK